MPVFSLLDPSSSVLVDLERLRYVVKTEFWTASSSSAYTQSFRGSANGKVFFYVRVYFRQPNS